MKALAEYRKIHNLSQVGLANALKQAGIKVSPASIAMYETGQRMPPLEKAQAIARFFKVSTDDIFFGPVAHAERANSNKHTGTDG